MNRWLVLMYGLFCYLAFLGVFLYALGFVGNFLVPTRLDSIPTISAEQTGMPWLSTDLFVNMILLSVFAGQHSVMARPWFKDWLRNWVPDAMERSTYVLASSLALALLFWQWRPLGGMIWEWNSPVGQFAMYGIFAAGWLTVLTTTFLIDHFDLFGLKQVWFHFCRKRYSPPQFRTPGPYRIVRHPMYIGWLLAFWGTPTMTVSHLVFASVVTVYILVAIRLEETDLVRFLGPAYADYRTRVPMLIPRVWGGARPKLSRGSNSLESEGA